MSWLTQLSHKDSDTLMVCHKSDCVRSLTKKEFTEQVTRLLPTLAEFDAQGVACSENRVAASARARAWYRLAGGVNDYGSPARRPQRRWWRLSRTRRGFPPPSRGLPGVLVVPSLVFLGFLVSYRGGVKQKLEVAAA